MNASRLSTPLILLSLVFFCHCTSENKENPEIASLQKRITEMEQKYATYDEKIKAAEYDHGLQINLGQEKELLKSRLERLKERLKMLGGGSAPAAEGGGGGGGHH